MIILVVPKEVDMIPWFKVTYVSLWIMQGRFEFEKKDGQINMRVPKSLLDALKKRAKARGIPYTQLIRETLEQAISTQDR